MTNLKHTPGPWHLDEDEGSYTIKDENDEYVQYISMTRYVDEREDPEAEANAHLMVAAPELLSWLVEALDELERDINWLEEAGVAKNCAVKERRTAIKNGRELIAKATGEKP